MSIYRIQDPRFLPKSPVQSWILDLGSAILKLNVAQYFNMDLPDPRYLPKSPVQSWILDLGSAILKLNVAQYFNMDLPAVIIKKM